MPIKLKISFDSLENGWVRLNIASKLEHISFNASFTPNDSFLELTNALFYLLSSEIEARVVWNSEPVEVEMVFSKSGEKVDLEIYEYPDFRRENKRGNNIFAISGSYDEICLPFWRALRDLQGRYSVDELNTRWHRLFPSSEIDLLTEKINEARLKLI